MNNTNNLKTFTETPFGGTKLNTQYSSFTEEAEEEGDYQSPPFNPNEGVSPGRGALTTTIQIIDAATGKPLVNAHVNPGGVTNQNGEITLNANSPTQIFTISYVGYRTHQAAFQDLIDVMISLQPGVNLPPVVINPKPKPTPTPAPTTQQKANKTLLWGLAGAALIFGIAFLGSKPKKAKKSRKNKIVTV